ncbi:HPP family protein [Chitinibacter sp. FCG-7]|uniref:HPP family protein n=1 Tax=Chitinibacter mangrovi TaxID=3153927 RepID=A0AAU7F912_9NEIS
MSPKAFLPALPPTHRKECLLGALGAALGLIGTELLCQWLLGVRPHWLIAPMGASAVLLFAAPASPLAQPWSLIVGNLLSALVGVSCAMLIDNMALASGVAVMLAIALMLLTRSLHPPGGAVALSAVIGGPEISSLAFQYVLAPVAINSALLLLIALLYSRLAGRRYPNYTPPPAPHHTSDPLPSQRVGTSEEDIAYALEQQEQLLDISPQDLQHILQDAQRHARQQNLRELRCADVMSRSIISIDVQNSGSDAWQKLAFHRVQALPVVGSAEKLVGIVTLHNLMVDPHTQQARSSQQMSQPLAKLMTRAVHTAAPQQALLELVPLFSDGGVHHLPVVADGELVGMIAQSDMIAVLAQYAARDTESTLTE